MDNNTKYLFTGLASRVFSKRKPIDLEESRHDGLKDVTDKIEDHGVTVTPFGQRASYVNTMPLNSTPHQIARHKIDRNAILDVDYFLKDEVLTLAAPDVMLDGLAMSPITSARPADRTSNRSRHLSSDVKSCKFEETTYNGLSNCYNTEDIIEALSDRDLSDVNRNEVIVARNLAESTNNGLSNCYNTADIIEGLSDNEETDVRSNDVKCSIKDANTRDMLTAAWLNETDEWRNSTGSLISPPTSFYNQKHVTSTDSDNDEDCTSVASTQSERRYRQDEMSLREIHVSYSGNASNTDVKTTTCKGTKNCLLRKAYSLPYRKRESSKTLGTNGSMFLQSSSFTTNSDLFSSLSAQNDARNSASQYIRLGNKSGEYVLADCTREYQDSNPSTSSSARDSSITSARNTSITSTSSASDSTINDVDEYTLTITSCSTVTDASSHIEVSGDARRAGSDVDGEYEIECDFSIPQILTSTCANYSVNSLTARRDRLRSDSFLEAVSGELAQTSNTPESASVDVTLADSSCVSLSNQDVDLDESCNLRNVDQPGNTVYVI